MASALFLCFYSFVSLVCHWWCPPFSAGHVAFLFICLPGMCHCWCPPFSAGHVAFLFICLPGLSLVVSALFRWLCSISFHLSPRSVTAGVPPFSVGHAAFLFIHLVSAQVCHFLFMCLPGLSLVVSALCRWPCSISLFFCLPGLSLALSALFRWPCSISIHLSPRSVTAGAMSHFVCSFVSQVCHWWCPPLFHVAFLFVCLFLLICLPGLSLLVSALFRWPCSISTHLSPQACPALVVRPCSCFYSLVSQVCHCWCPPFSAGDATFLFICFPGLSLLVSALFRWACSISIHLFPGSVTGAAALFRWSCSISIHLSPM